MTEQLTVGATPEATTTGAIAEVIASLPVSMRAGDSAAGLVAVSGPGWASEAITVATGGARGILATDPVFTDFPTHAEELLGAKIPIVVDTTWAYNPAVDAAASHFAALNPADTMLESRVETRAGSDLARVLLAQLALIRRATGSAVTTLSIHRWKSNGYTAIGSAENGAEVALDAILTDVRPPSAALWALTRQAAVRLTVPDPTTATFGTVTISDQHGAVLLPTAYETAHRAAWRELHRRVNVGATTNDLPALLADLALVVVNAS